MKKEQLMKLDGMTDALADKLLETFKDYIPKSRFDEVNEAKKNAEALVKERDSQLETLKNSVGDVDNLKKQIEQLQTDNKAAVEAKDAEIKQIKVDNAVKTALTEAGAKNVKAVMPFLKLDNAQLDADGTVTGLAGQIDALKKAEDSSFLFNDATPKQQKPFIKGAKPKSDGEAGAGKGTITKEQFARMGYKKRAELFEQDKDLYNSLAKDDVEE